MKNTTVLIVVVWAMVSGGILGALWILPEPVNEVREYHTEVRYVTASPTPTTIITPIATQTPWPEVHPNTQTGYNAYRKYGGIPASINNPPNGARFIALNYPSPTAIDSQGRIYYFVGSWGWFNQSEYNALPESMRLSDTSPYDGS